MIVVPTLLVTNTNDELVDEGTSETISDGTRDVLIEVVVKKLANGGPCTQDIRAVVGALDCTDRHLQNYVIDVVLNDVVVLVTVAGCSLFTVTNDWRVEVEEIKSATEIDEKRLLTRTSENADILGNAAAAQEVVCGIDEIFGIVIVVGRLAKGLIADIGEGNLESIIALAMSDDGRSTEIITVSGGWDVLVVVEVVGLDEVDGVGIDVIGKIIKLIGIIDLGIHLEGNLNRTSVGSCTYWQSKRGSGIGRLAEITLGVIVIIGVVFIVPNTIKAATKVELEDLSRVDSGGITNQMELKKVLVREGIIVRTSIGILETSDAESKDELTGVERGLEHVEISDIRRGLLGSTRSLRVRGGRCLEHQCQSNSNQKDDLHCDLLLLLFFLLLLLGVFQKNKPKSDHALKTEHRFC